jgi:hypothetical protein
MGETGGVTDRMSKMSKNSGNDVARKNEVQCSMVLYSALHTTM